MTDQTSMSASSGAHMGDLVVLEGIVGDAALEDLVAREQARDPAGARARRFSRTPASCDVTETARATHVQADRCLAGAGASHWQGSLRLRQPRRRRGAP
jgi:hypothetical protein